MTGRVGGDRAKTDNLSPVERQSPSPHKPVGIGASLKSAHGSLLCPTVPAYPEKSGRGLTRWGITGAPCRNRTYNLMIKSQFEAPSSEALRAYATIKIATPERTGRHRTTTEDHGTSVYVVTKVLS